MANKKTKIFWLSLSSLLFVVGMSLAVVKLFFPELYTKLKNTKPEAPIYKNDGRIRIVIDAGHGGQDPGAVNKKLNLFEKNICRQIVDAIIANADTTKYYILETRPLDSNIHRHTRIENANLFNPRLLLTIHNNSFISSKYDGTEISYSDSSLNTIDSTSKVNPNKQLCIPLADSLSKNIAYVFPNMVNRGIRVRKDRIWMIYAGNYPSILVEFGYLSNPEDAKVLTDPLAHELLAKAIWYTVDKYFETNKVVNN